jgi:hypothetical protein
MSQINKRLTRRLFIEYLAEAGSAKYLLQAMFLEHLKPKSQHKAQHQ